MRHDTGTFVLALREARHHPGQVPSHLLLLTAGKELVSKSSAVQSTCAATTGKGHRALGIYVLCKRAKGKAKWTGRGAWVSASRSSDARCERPPKREPCGGDSACGEAGGIGTQAAL